MIGSAARSPEEWLFLSIVFTKGNLQVLLEDRGNESNPVQADSGCGGRDRLGQNQQETDNYLRCVWFLRVGFPFAPVEKLPRAEFTAVKRKPEKTKHPAEGVSTHWVDPISGRQSGEIGVAAPEAFTVPSEDYAQEGI
jgi:hypothetical protein